jgi:hypothetical protein
MKRRRIVGKTSDQLAKPAAPTALDDDMPASTPSLVDTRQRDPHAELLQLHQALGRVPNNCQYCVPCTRKRSKQRCIFRSHPSVLHALRSISEDQLQQMSEAWVQGPVEVQVKKSKKRTARDANQPTEAKPTSPAKDVPSPTRHRGVKTRAQRRALLGPMPGEPDNGPVTAIKADPQHAVHIKQEIGTPNQFSPHAAIANQMRQKRSASSQDVVNLLTPDNSPTTSSDQDAEREWPIRLVTTHGTPCTCGCTRCWQARQGVAIHAARVYCFSCREARCHKCTQFKNNKLFCLRCIEDVSPLPADQQALQAS